MTETIPNETEYTGAVDLKKRYPGAFTSSSPTPFQERCGSKIGPDLLHNQREPYYYIQHEKPEHLVAVYLKAEGNTNTEIAEAMGMSPVAISNILRQEWAVRRLTEIIHTNGSREVKELLSESQAAKSIRTLIEIRDNKNAQNADRIKAANAHIERVYGKAAQPVINHQGLNLEGLVNLPQSELDRYLPTTNGTGSQGCSGSQSSEAKPV